MIPHTFLRSPLPSGNKIWGRNCNSCAHRNNLRAGRNCGPQRRSRLFTHTHTHRPMMVNTPTASQIPEPVNSTAFAVPSKENPSKFSHTLSPSMSVSWNPGSQSQLYDLTPSTHVPCGPHLCIRQSSKFQHLWTGEYSQWLRGVFRSSHNLCHRERQLCVQCASSALREATLCVSRESSLHHCLSLKVVMSSRLRDSTPEWSAEDFNTTGVVVVRGKTSRVPSLSLLPCCASVSTHASEFCRYRSSAE